METKVEWISPDKFDGEVKSVDFYHVLAKKGLHPVGDWEPLYCYGIEDVDGHTWELLAVTKEADDRYWCTAIFGLGFFNIMVMKEDTRNFTDSERKTFEDMRMGVEGSHTGRMSYHFRFRLKPIEDRDEFKN